MRKLVLLRHGESIWNRKNRFTGWIDVKLSPKGEQVADSLAVRAPKDGGRLFTV